MDDNKTDRISRRAYELWEAEGRPHGRHEHHWHTAEQEFDEPGTTEPDTTEAAPGTATAPYPGMMGDGTEEQNLDQPGNPEARITEEEVEAAFAGTETDKSA